MGSLPRSGLVQLTDMVGDAVNGPVEAIRVLGILSCEPLAYQSSSATYQDFSSQNANHA